MLNALGALTALFYSQVIQKRYLSFADFLSQEYEKISLGLQNFSGAARRSELLGRIMTPLAALPMTGQRTIYDDILILDDYAHHPTAIRKTLAGMKKFYPSRRVVLDFMPHTYSRTKSLHNEFCHCFAVADLLILHDIYSSAREQKQPEGSHNYHNYNGRTFWQGVNEQRQKCGQTAAYYFPQPLEALPLLKEILQPGDLFITMGAGNNRSLAMALLK